MSGGKIAESSKKMLQIPHVGNILPPRSNPNEIIGNQLIKQSVYWIKFAVFINFNFIVLKTSEHNIMYTYK